jgi:hypothetical protein
MVLGVVSTIARSLAATALARVAVKLDPDAASDCVRMTVGELLESPGPIEMPDYDGPIVSKEAQSMVVPRGRETIRPEPVEDFPLVGSIAARRGR